MNSILLLGTNVIYLKDLNTIWLALPVQANVAPNSNSVILGGHDSDKIITGISGVR